MSTLFPRRWFVALGSVIVLLAIGYVCVEGSPYPLRVGQMFYEWRHGERGWGYWGPITWSDDRGNDLVMDYSRNLIAIGPASGISDWQTSTKRVVFFEETAHPVKIADTRDQVIIFDADGNVAKRAIAPGAASKLRSRLARAYGTEMRRRLQSELPQVYEVIDSWKREESEK